MIGVIILWFSYEIHGHTAWCFSCFLQPGYYVKPVGPHSFTCQKLGQISVRIYSKEDAKEPFPSVLLSLSGEDGYRNNSITGTGGIFLFDNLFPGSFYLRPLLKVHVWHSSFIWCWSAWSYVFYCFFACFPYKLWNFQNSDCCAFSWLKLRI